MPPRLGELLVEAGELAAHDVEQALRAQVMWGGRIGTNLVELGYIDLDKLAGVLGKQHRLPAALGRHFDKSDPALQARLSPELAERYSCIPLLFAGPARSQLIIASMGRLDRAAITILAAELRVDPRAIVQSVAGELRIRYHLERVYNIQRATRFLRSRGKTIPPFPQLEIDPLAFEDSQVDTPTLSIPTSIAQTAADATAADSTAAAAADPTATATADPAVVALVADAAAASDAAAGAAAHDDDDDDDDLAIEEARGELRARLESKEAERARRASVQVATRPATEPPGEGLGPEDLQALESLAMLDDDGVAIPELVDAETSSGRERRRYLRMLDADPSADDDLSAFPEASPIEQSLGRIPIKRLQLSAAVDEPPVGMNLTLGEATRAIRRSQDRDRVAELVSETLFRFMLSCDAAQMLVIRGDAAIGWKGFSRAGATLPEIAVPLDQPGLVPRAIERCQTCRAPSTDLTPIDQLLLVSLGVQRGDLVIVPVSISNRVMCVIAMATQPDASPATAESIAAAAGAAFARLMRNASR